MAKKKNWLRSKSPVSEEFWIAFVEIAPVLPDHRAEQRQRIGELVARPDPYALHEWDARVDRDVEGGGRDVGVLADAQMGQKRMSSPAVGPW